MHCQLTLLFIALIGVVLTSLKTFVGEVRLVNFLTNVGNFGPKCVKTLSRFMRDKGVNWLDKIGNLLIIIGIIGNIFILLL